MEEHYNHYNSRKHGSLGGCHRVGDLVYRECPIPITEAHEERRMGAPLTSLIESLSQSAQATKSEPTVKDDPLGGLFTGKAYMLQAKAELLYDELASRYTLRDETIVMLNVQQSKMQSEIWNLERWVAGIPLIEDKKSRLEQEILKIEKDKHDEATKFWKDTTGVKDELLETVRELRKVQGHQELLSSPEPETQGTAQYKEGLLY